MHWGCIVHPYVICFVHIHYWTFYLHSDKKINKILFVFYSYYWLHYCKPFFELFHKVQRF